MAKPELKSFVVHKCLGQCALTGADISPGDKIVSRDGIPIANLPKTSMKEGQVYTFKVDRNGREHTVSLTAQVMQYDGWIHPSFEKDMTKKSKKRTTARSPRDEFILD